MRTHHSNGAKRVLTVVAGIAVIGLALLALTPTLNTASAQDSKKGGTLRISFQAIRQLDPYKTGGNNDEGNATSMVFDSLIYIDKDRQPAPLLAERWENPDDTTWIFTLRKGVTFHDENTVFPKGKGREVVAADVVYSINRFNKVSNAFTIGDIAGVRAVDKYTVEIKTKAADPFLLSDPNRLAVVSIVPQEAVEKLGETGFAQRPVGSGPFKLQSFTVNRLVTFKRNDKYWIPVNLDRVQFVYLPDPTVTTIALQGNRIDVVPYLLNIDSAKQLSTNKNIKLVDSVGSYRGLGFNVKTAPFNDINVREAIAKAIDIDAAVKAVVAPYGIRAYGQVPPWVTFGYDSSLKDLWSYDPKGAVALLAKAGYSEKNSDGFYVKNKQPLTVEIKTIAGTQVRVLTILVTQLKEFGIDARILQQDVSVWANDLVKGNETGVFFDFSYAGSTGLFALFASENIGGSNTHQYSNPAADALFAQALKTIDAGRRGQLWKQAQRLIMRDRVAIPLYFENGFSAVNSKVMDWVPAYGPLHLVSPGNNVYLAK